MTGRFTYLLTSLPPLSRDRPAPLDRESFLEQAGRHLPGQERAGLAAIRLWSPDGPVTPWRAERLWLRFELDLRHALASARARLQERESLVRPVDALLADAPLARSAVTSAVEESDPLRAERTLFEARWRFLEERDRESFHARDNIVIYLLKRDLLAEWHDRSAERGRNALANLRRVAATEWPGDEFATPDETFEHAST